MYFPQMLLGRVKHAKYLKELPLLYLLWELYATEVNGGGRCDEDHVVTVRGGRVQKTNR